MRDFLHPTAPATMLAASIESIESIRTAAGFPEQQFNSYFVPILREYARHVQSLPLSNDAYSESDGAWLFGLTASLLALRIASTKMFFPTLDSEARRMLEPQCRFAAFTATLATGVALVSQNGRLSTADDQYHPLTAVEPLYEWLGTAKKPSFQWRVDEPKLTSAECAGIAALFLPRGLFRHFDLRIPLMVHNSIAPPATNSGVETVLSRVVRIATEKAIELYTTRAKAEYRAPDAIRVPLIQDAAKLADALEADSNGQPDENPLDSPPKDISGKDSGSPLEAGSTSQEPAPQDALKDASAVLQEWFKAVTSHERYSEFKDKLNVTSAGIEVPVVMLGSFGINGPTIRKYMEEAGLVIGRSANGRSLTLIPTLKPVLFSSSP